MAWCRGRGRWRGMAQASFDSRRAYPAKGQCRCKSETNMGCFVHVQRAGLVQILISLLWPHEDSQNRIASPPARRSVETVDFGSLTALVAPQCKKEEVNSPIW